MAKTQVNENGAIRDVKAIHLNINGAIRDTKQAVVNENGAIREVFRKDKSLYSNGTQDVSWSTVTAFGSGWDSTTKVSPTYAADSIILDIPQARMLFSGTRTSQPFDFSSFSTLEVIYTPDTVIYPANDQKNNFLMVITPYNQNMYSSNVKFEHFNPSDSSFIGTNIRKVFDISAINGSYYLALTLVTASSAVGAKVRIKEVKLY